MVKEIKRGIFRKNKIYTDSIYKNITESKTQIISNNNPIKIIRKKELFHF